MTTARQLVTDALIDLGQIDPAESVTDTGMLTTALRSLNRMIGSWAMENLLIPYTTTENFSLTSGTASYTMGSGGTASSTRAETVEGGFIRDSNSHDTPLRPITQRQYNDISDKTITGIPYRFFYDPVYATGVLYFYPTPTSGLTAYIESTKHIHSELSLGDTLSLPLQYEFAIVTNLRNHLAGSYGINVSQFWFNEADMALRNIKNINLNNRQDTMDMPPGAGSRLRGYSIEEG